MTKRTEYEKNIEIILEKMNQKENIIRAPRSEEILKILKIVYDEKDAAIGSKMDIIPEDPEEIAKRLNMTKDEIIPILEQMCDRGLLYRTGEKGSYKYNLFATDVGLFETSFGKGEDNERTRKLAKLWNDYYNNVWGEDFHSLKTQFTRIIPIEEEIPGKQEVLPYEKVSDIIENASYLTVTNCACKSSKIFAGEPCSRNAPTEMCLHFEELGRHFVERGFAREITKEDAHEIVKKAEDLGLVHLTINTREHILAICSCCPCCCVALRGITQLNKPDAVAHSNYFASIGRKVCDGCKDLPSPICVDRCPVNAISLKKGKAVSNVETCIGCGICAYFCPLDAITLKKKKKVQEPKRDLIELITSVIQERSNHSPPN